jgi:hypothetical protein
MFEAPVEKLYDLVIALIDSGEINTSRVLKAANNITMEDEDESQTILVELIAMLKKSEEDPEGKGLKAARAALTELLDDEIS